VFDLRVDAKAFLECVRKAADIWLRRRGGDDEVDVTVDGDAVAVRLRSKSSSGGFEGVQRFRMVNGSVPATRAVAGDAASTDVESGGESDFDAELFDLIGEEMVRSDDLISGTSGDLT
jgi:hypothetical protein